MKTHQLIVIATAFMLSCSDQATDNKKGTSTTLSDENRCALVPDPGPCKALLKKYYYDKTEGKCKEFNWGGCDGVVPFETLEECEKCKNK